jgi:hypothetical protein
MCSADLYKTTGEPIPLAGGELRFAKNYLTSFDLTMWLADRNPLYVIMSPVGNATCSRRLMTAAKLRAAL